jgi:Zn-dependent membrane protease YugP
MHPALILLPAAALVIGPRLWVRHVMGKHAEENEAITETAAEFARTLLDQHDLPGVKVELTDTGDHYDPSSRSVRLARDKYDSRSLAALTTASHEVAHALQHATGYVPFAWRARLVRVAQVTGQAGTVLLLAVPAASLVSRKPLPPALIGVAALSMLGTGVAAQLATLPTELDASFQRALPMLQGVLPEENLGDAREILVACSMTYVASSLAGVIHIWPWVGRGTLFLLPPTPFSSVGARANAPGTRPTQDAASRTVRSRKNTIRGGLLEKAFRRTAKPLVRQWLRAACSLRKSR